MLVDNLQHHHPAGKIVVFDSHEDVPKQLLGKPYLAPLARRFLSRSISAYERYACARLDGQFTATRAP